MRKTNRSYWSISEFSEKFGSATIPVKLREGWSRKIFPNQISHAQALSRQACVNFTTALHSWSGPARLCIQTDEGKDDAHIERMEKRPVNTSSSFALISAPPARRLPWNWMFSRWKSCFFLLFFFNFRYYKHFTEEPGRHWGLHTHKHACWELCSRNAQLGSGQPLV